MNTNPTQVTGLIVFGLATLACWRAARRWHGPWTALTAAQFACFAEILVGMRFRVHDAVDAVLQSLGVYGYRTPWQMALLVLVIAATAFALSATLRWRGRDADATRALAATIVSIALFVVESVSLHDVDTLAYHPVGPIMTIAIAWVAASVLVIASAWRAAAR